MNRKVLCLLLQQGRERSSALAEACLAFSPQVAVGTEAVFLELAASRALFSAEECLHSLQSVLQTLDLRAKTALASDPSTALAFARYDLRHRELLPIAALADYMQPFSPKPFAPAHTFCKLGIKTIGNFLQLPPKELASRFGPLALLARERVLGSAPLAWPRFSPSEQITERVDFDCAAQIECFAPVLFLLKTSFDRIFLRLQARRLKLARLEVKFHLNRLSGAPERRSSIALPLPQSDAPSVLRLVQERLQKELELRPLEDALEGVTVCVEETAPLLDTQRDFFSRVEEEQEAWASLVGRLRERLGEQSTFLAAPSPRLLPEGSWHKCLQLKEEANFMDTPLRPLRLLHPPLRLRRLGDQLATPGQAARRWQILAFVGPEKLQGEWWLGGFEREYYKVDTAQGETLWVFSTPSAAEEGGPRSLFLQGIYD